MLKKIVLLDKEYPCQRGRSFVCAEEKWFPKDIVIDAVPWGFKPDGETNPVPDNVRMNGLLWNRMSAAEHFLYCAGALFFVPFWQDIARLGREKKLSVRSFGKTLSFVARGNRMFRLLEREYRGILRSEPESVVFYSFWLLMSAYAAARLKRKYGCHAVSRAHGGDLFEERIAYGRLPMRVYTLENLDFTAACSEEGRRYLEEKYGCGDIRTVYLGTEDHGQTASARSADGKPFTVVSCSNVIPLKRVELIAEALGLITDADVEWYHFGDGTSMQSVREAAGRLPENIRPHIMGALPHDELMKWYGEHPVDLFVNVSETEGLPVSVMEAMSFGIPVLATLAGGTGEALREDHSVSLPVDTDPEQIAEGIRLFMEMPEDQYAGFRRNARSFWEENFSAERNYTQFYGWLADL